MIKWYESYPGVFGKQYSALECKLRYIFAAANCRHAGLGALVTVKLHFLKTIN